MNKIKLNCINFNVFFSIYCNNILIIKLYFYGINNFFKSSIFF